ncbi:MAG: 23S rRNA (uracil(1939)-C(5))-methyltransferase RlmD [Pseudomonadales bacterium]|nr:23S rRNA (uracil(1939)-C(5))-methyltransferase RlmD [Pseudomonadales bacterium]
MARRRTKKLPQEPIEVKIEKLSHEGRGIAYTDGKTQFVEGALPGETVMAKFVDSRGKFDELATVEVLVPGPDRVEPPCAHAQLCGGCSLQHMESKRQIELKESVLLEQLQHFGQITPDELIPPMVDQTTGYRRKARLGVKYVHKRDEVLVGFREKRSSFLTDIRQCEVLDPRIGTRMMDFREMLATLDARQSIPQIEVAAGDDCVALVFRHLVPLTEQDIERLIAFGQAHQFDIYLQPKGPTTVHRIWPAEGAGRLTYRLPEFDVTMHYHPMDFTQVNAGINQKMVHRAIEWLDPQPEDRILDLFCGLGNFTIPLATVASHVIGVEGDEEMVRRGSENAKFNNLNNVAFHAANLQADFTQESWASEGFDKILIDPPRSGALDVVSRLSRFGANRIVYVSCNPATLARDTRELIDQGYKLLKAGVMDMFPHTTHVESIALFEK